MKAGIPGVSRLDDWFKRFPIIRIVFMAELVSYECQQSRSKEEMEEGLFTSSMCWFQYWKECPKCWWIWQEEVEKSRETVSSLVMSSFQDTPNKGTHIAHSSQRPTNTNIMFSPQRPIELATTREKRLKSWSWSSLVPYLAEASMSVLFSTTNLLCRVTYNTSPLSILIIPVLPPSFLGFTISLLP